MIRLIWGLITVTLLLCSGCAVFNRNNTPALNFVEQKMIPSKNPERMLSYPLAIPVGLAAASLDILILHPATVVKDAWSDTGEMLWKNMDWKNHYITSAASLLPRAAASPLVFTGDFLARSSFDISRKGGDVRLIKNAETGQAREEKAAGEKLLAEGQNALEHADLQAALALAEEILKKEPGNRQAALIKATVYLEQRNLKGLAGMPQHLPLFIDDNFCRLFAEQLSNGSPADRMQLLAILERNYFVFSAKHAAQADRAEPRTSLMSALKQNLVDGDRAIRLKTMQLLGKYRHSDPSSRELLEKLARGDDPVLAAAAAGLLR